MMNLKHKNGAIRGGLDQENEKVVLIAVKASREISRNALVWALNHVVQPGDCAKMLVIIPANTPSNKIWGFSKFNGDCTTGQWKSLSGLNIRDQKDDIQESCSQIMLQLHEIYASDKIKMKIKVVSAVDGVVAAEAKKNQTQWVVLDKKLKKEAKICIERLECNVVVMKKSHPKVLRLNLAGSSPEKEAPADCVKEDETIWNATKVPNVTPVSSPERSEPRICKLSSFDLGFSPYFVADHDWDSKKNGSNTDTNMDTDTDTDTDSENMNSSLSTNSSSEFLKNTMEKSSKLLNERVLINPITDKLRLKFTELDHVVKKSTKNVPEMIPLTRNMPPKPPPLCSICQHKAPVFGKPPKWFGFRELEEATNGFSAANFLAEGGFGSVHRGVLKDGRMVAVKQHKLASSQGDHEFFSEVDVLSCAQHRNVVMLIGFCVEDTRRLLVYEFICNGSLDSHLYGHDHGPLEWCARQKIAIGAARGLRYLHEECRVGCIVHRDMRPNNILLTHDFEALVGDFGLARWQPDGDTGVETRIIGTFGYLAPEYAQSGEITEKADVYSFGVVLVELITGRKAVDITRPKGQQYLTEWARPLLEENAIAELTDPRLRGRYSEPEVLCMAHCASLCIRRDPHSRPRMSQVLWMLENDNIK